MGSTFNLRMNYGLWLLTAGQAVQLSGDHLLTVAVSAYTYGMTGSTWGFALQQLVLYLPWLLFSASAGFYVDRFDRRKLMLAADVSRALTCFLYPLCGSLEAILALNFVGSVCRVFGMTARTALIPTLCTKDALLKVNGIRASILGAVNLIVPSVAGVLVAEIGTKASFPFTAVLGITGAVLYVFIRPGGSYGSGKEVLDTDSPSEGKREAFGEEPDGERSKNRGEALTFIKSERTLLVLIALFCVYTAGQTGVNAIFYPFMSSVLKTGPEVFGISVSLYFGTGLIAGAVLVRYGNAIRRSSPIALAILPMTAWLVYSVARKVSVILALSVIEGFVLTILTNILVTEVQSRSPTNLTGRVWGVTQTLTSASEVCGILAVGALGEKMGPALAYRCVGMGSLAIVGLFAFSMRVLTEKRAKVNARLSQFQKWWKV